MSKLVVYRASAGSGKTFRLAAEYLKQVITKPESFANILAVTFTNKATAEMKGRILNELFAISKGNQTAMWDEIKEELGLEDNIIRNRAQQALSLILHDYSRFAISTIDSFVQRVIQSLLWEIGEQGGVDIELDTTPVLEHAADNLIDSASKFDELLNWLTSMGHSLMDEGKSWDVRRKLIELGKQIFSEKFRLMDHDDIQKFTDKQRVDQLKKSLQSQILSIISEIRSKAQTVFKEIAARSINLSEFSYGETGALGVFYRSISLDESSNELPDTNKARTLNALNDTTGEVWVRKDTFNDKQLFSPIEAIIKEVLHPSLVSIIQTIETKRILFNTAKLILKNLDNLALIGDLWNKVRELSREEGFLLLSDSNHLLKEFVKESDAPFIYEKVGTRYDVYMIDEFQDTSEVQWHNFKPLINNSLSLDNFSMIVGDVKQSIYRWRNGDWSILASGVEEDFKHLGIEEKYLDINRRSLPKIVEFNNTFFEKAKEFAIHIIEKTNESINRSILNKYKEQINKAYKDINQKIPDRKTEDQGYVEINLVTAKNNSEYNHVLEKNLPDLINQLKKNNRLEDIAILVRSNKEGQKIANILLAYNRNEPDGNNHIGFVSQEGLLLKSSPVVRLIISAFRLVQDPSNDIAKKIITKELVSIRNNLNTPWHKVFEESTSNEEIEWLSKLNTRPLQEAFESIANRYQLFKLSGDLGYLSELHEHISTLSAKGIGDIGRFLEWWEQKSDNLSLSIPKSTNAISILTIHKSKGLQFPIVIIPYANWQFRQNNRAPLLWVDSSEEPYNMLPKYPIYANKKAEVSLFAQDIIEEAMKDIVDNINLIYVAFTRPENELYVFVQKSENESEKKSNSTTSISDLIISIVPTIENSSRSDVNEAICSTFCFGNKIQNSNQLSNELERKESWIIDTYPVAESFKDVKFKLEAEEFFLSIPSDKLSNLNHGKIMHELFSRIKTKDDVRKAINELIIDGQIALEESMSLGNKIHDLLTNEPFKTWFSGQWQTKTEASIATSDGHIYRPDRVMIKDKEALVLDFKFGAEQPSHKKQIERYMKLLTEMSYNPVHGYVWYVDQNKLDKIS